MRLKTIVYTKGGKIDRIVTNKWVHVIVVDEDGKVDNTMGQRSPLVEEVQPQVSEDIHAKHTGEEPVNIAKYHERTEPIPNLSKLFDFWRR